MALGFKFIFLSEFKVTAEFQLLVLEFGRCIFHNHPTVMEGLVHAGWKFYA